MAVNRSLTSFSFLLSTLLLFTGVSCDIKITKVTVPPTIIAGEGGVLVCNWSTEGDVVYSVKWYCGLNEFYRYTPAADPPIQIFERKELRVDEKKSGMGRVQIENVQLEAAGQFLCEVSTEAPFFHTDSMVADVKVVDLPDAGPFIEGLQTRYQLGDELYLNCTSPHSKPAADLKFYVNDELADPSWLVERPPSKDPRTGLETAILGLRLRLRSRQLEQDSHLYVKCVAAIPGVYFKSTVETIVSDLPYHASILDEERANAACRPTTSHVLCLLTFLVASGAKLLLS